MGVTWLRSGMMKGQMMAPGGAPVVATYAEVLRDDFGASEIWPLVNIASGTTIPAFINSARNGTLTGWDLQNAAGPVTGTLAPLEDGTNDFGNIDNAGHDAIFNGDEFSFLVWAKVSGVGVWTDGVTRHILQCAAPGGLFQVVKLGGSNATRVRRTVSAAKGVDFTTTTTDWFSIGMSCTVAGDALKVYFNGAQQGATQTTISGSFGTPTLHLLGALSITPTAVWSGFLAYYAVKYGGIWSDADFAAMHAAVATAGPD